MAENAINYRIEKEEVAKLTRDMDDCYDDLVVCSFFGIDLNAVSEKSHCTNPGSRV